MKQYYSLIFLLFVVSSDPLTAQEMNETGKTITQTDTLKNEMTSKDEKGSKFNNLLKSFGRKGSEKDGSDTDTLKNEVASTKQEEGSLPDKGSDAEKKTAREKRPAKGSMQISIQALERGDLVPMEVDMINEMIYTMTRDLGILNVLDPNRYRADSVHTLTSGDSGVPPTTTEYNMNCDSDSCAAQNALLEGATHVLSWAFDQFNSLTFHFFNAADYLSQDNKYSWTAFKVPVDPESIERIKFPQALAIDEKGDLLVASANSQSLMRVGRDHRVTDIVSGMVYNENLISPAGMTTGPGGTVYVSDTDNHRVFSATQGIFQQMVDRNTTVYNGGTIEQVRPESPTAIRSAPDGSFVILFEGDQAVRRLDTRRTLTTVLNSGVVEGMTDLALDGDGRIYVVSPHMNQVFRVENETTVVPVAGTPTGEGLKGDGVPAIESGLSEPVAIDFDELGRMFVAERGRGLVRMIDKSGNIYTLAGGGIPWDGRQPREGTHVQLDHLTHMRVGPGSMVYISRSVEHSIECIAVAEIPSWIADTTLIAPLHIISSSGIAGLEPDLRRTVAMLLKGHTPKKPIGQRLRDLNIRLARYFRAKPVLFAILLLLASQATSAALGGDGEALGFPPDFP